MLRVLGNLLQLDGFDQDSSEAVRDEVVPEDMMAPLSNETTLAPDLPRATDEALERIADVPIHFSDAIVRRAPSLQATADARPPRARMNAATAAKLGLADGSKVRLRQGEGVALLDLQIDEGVADGTVRVAAAHVSTAGLGSMFGTISVERA